MEEDVYKLRQKAAVFILITNAGKDDASDVELLKAYKATNRRKSLASAFSKAPISSVISFWKSPSGLKPLPM